jgi:glycosyltransferase involved in cell wall biosynthesis
MITVGADIRVLGAPDAGGIREYTSQVLSHMTALDRGVRWRLFWAGRRAIPREPWMQSSSVSVVDAGVSNRALWARTLVTGRPALDQMVGGADVFFFPHFLLSALTGACRRVMAWHDLSYETMPELFGIRRRLWHQVQMRPRTQAVASDRIIAVSRSTADDLRRQYGIAPERITVVPSGIAPSVVRPEDGDIERFRARMNLPRRFILSLGTLEPRKNLEALVAAFEHIAENDAELHLILAGPRGWLMGALEHRVRRSSVRARIRFAGAVASAERALWLSAAHLVAYPSLLEGFGFPPLEAMACGTPVVASANSSLVETLHDAALLVNPYSVGSLVSAIGALTADERLRELLVRRGIARAASFTWPRAAEATLAAILSTVRPRSS